jgi:ElaB/YqjD/DUF883 family membrane-anchored ribosome-binding protein
MTRRKRPAAGEIAAIENLMSDLEKRLQRLNGAAKSEASGASSDIQDFVAALAGIMKQVGGRAGSAVESAAEDVTRAGTSAFKRVIEGIEDRPIAMLAMAAGVGYIVGLTRR